VEPYLFLGDLILLVCAIQFLLIGGAMLLNVLISKRSVETSFWGFKIKLGEPVRVHLASKKRLLEISFLGFKTTLSEPARDQPAGKAT
jgi:hypothetical protein